MALRCAFVSGITLVLVSGLLAVNYTKRQPYNPLDVQEYRHLKEALLKSPTDEGLKARIRELDLQLRREHFDRLGRSENGAYLLLGSILVFVLSMKWVFACRRPLPLPVPEDQEEEPRSSHRLALASVGVSGLALLVSGVVLAISGGGVLDRESSGELLAAKNGAGYMKPHPEQPSYPTSEEIARNWSRFRGPGGLGVSAAPEAELSFNAATGEGILWKTAVPLPGNSSPVVWGDRIFLTGATAEKREVYCFEAGSGKILWQEPVVTGRGAAEEPPEVQESTGFAAPTPVADGSRVYASFATGDVAAFDFAGKKVWARKLGPLDNPYGHGTSLELYRNLLYVLLDQATDTDGKSALLALDVLTGRPVWEAKRPVAASWATPIVAATPGGDQLITSANPWVIAYEPLTGAEIWKADCMGGDVAPSPIFSAGLVFAVNTDADLVAIRPDGRGDVTQSHIAWKGEEGLPDITSPLSDGKLIFLLTTSGTFTCYDVATGEVVWKEKLRLPCHSSPTLVGSRIHLWTKKGILIVAEAGRAYKEISRNELGEEVNASPAVLPGRVYVRGEKNLYCFGKKP